MADDTTRNPVDRTDINWNKIDKTKFYLYGSGMYTGFTAILHPIQVVKTRMQVVSHDAVDRNAYSVIKGLLKSDGIRGLYKGLGTVAVGLTPGRILFVTVLENSKEITSKMIEPVRLSQPTQAAVVNGIAGTVAAICSQTIFVPIDVVSQRLMVQGYSGHAAYSGGLDVVRKIIMGEGIQGLYRGFGLSVMTSTPSNAVWWASYGASQRMIWRLLGHDTESSKTDLSDSKIFLVHTSGAIIAGALGSCISTPLDTIKTRLQVIGHEKQPTIKEVFRNLIAEEGWTGLYRGLGARFFNTTAWGTSLILSYEYLKRICAKDE